MYKKVLLYIDSMQLGGAERVMANLAQSLNDMGKSVVLVNDIIPDKNMLEYTLSRRIKRLFLSDDPPTPHKQSNLKRIRNLRSIIRNENPDVVISFLGPPNLRTLIAKFGIKTRAIVSVRNDPSKEYGSGIKKIITNLIFYAADGCVFQTQEASMYFNKGVRDKSKIIFNPVDPKFFCQELQVENQSISVIGRLQNQKNPEMAIRAFALIHNEFPDYKLVFYGEGELKDGLRKLSKDLGVSEQVFFPGQNDNIPEVLSRTTVYLLTSFYEGMPNALMEAMAIGVPVIATDCPCGGPATLIRNASEGILIPVGDINKLANKLSLVLHDKEYRDDLRRNAKKRAAAFESNKVIEQWDNYINMVCSKK